MWPWLVKLIGGWIPIGTKPVGEWLGKLLWVVGIILMVSLATNLFEKIIPSKPNVTIGSGGTYQAAEPRDTIGIGCNLWRWYVKGGMKNK
uniref:Uncharacterized protein n=1 Tax=viral metagenome TaxID=1070528 RepID=A0A6M3JYS7_9ZZZZ